MARNGLERLTLSLDGLIDKDKWAQRVAAELTANGTMPSLFMMPEQDRNWTARVLAENGTHMADSLDFNAVVGLAEETLQDEVFLQDADLERIMGLVAMIALHRQKVDVSQHYDVSQLMGNLLALYSRFDNLRHADGGYRVTDVIQAVDEGRMDWHDTKYFTDELFVVRGRYPGLVRGSPTFADDWIRSFYGKASKSPVYVKIADGLDKCFAAMQYMTERIAEILKIRPDASLLIS
jgi:hypothetical protein